MHRHDRVCRFFDKITAEWPERELPGPRDMPEMDDLQAMLDSMPSEIDLPEFPSEIPEVDPAELTAHARRVLDAIGDYQGRKSRRQNKNHHESLFQSPQGRNAIGGVSLDDFPRCA